MWRARTISLLLLMVPACGWAEDTTHDTEAPVVTITSLKDQDAVGGKVDIAADASDNVAVAEVTFYKDDTLIKSDTESPFSAGFDFNADTPDQTYQIKIVAKDTAGNETAAAIDVRKPKHSFQPPGGTLSDNGAFFKVWAPHANKVALIGDFNQWDRSDHLLWNAGGWWFGFEPEANMGHKYKYAINGTIDRPDPYGRQMEHSAGASIIVSTDMFNWTDGQWKTPRFENMIIYELHVGTFVGKNDGQNYPGSFQNLLTKLDYIKGLGANMIELLPVHETPGPDHPNPTPYLGYAPTGLFAVESSYSSRNAPSYQELKAVVDAAHSKGLGVIMDVVYNHFSTNGGRDNWYWDYDGDSEGNDGGIYFDNQHTQWGIAPDWDRNEVRDYIKKNCQYWLNEFHLDGLRWDATTEIKNKPGGWDAMRDIVWSMRQEFPSKIMICENLPYESEMVRSGNFHSGWWVNLHHQIEKAFKDEANANLNDVRNGINGGDYADPTQRVIFAMSHDECRNGGSYLISEFGGRGSWHAHAKSRASAAISLLSPGIPMIWQGEEFAQDGWFDDNYDHAVDWKYERDSDGWKMKELYKHTIQLRWDSDAIRRGSLEWTHEDTNNKVIAFRRDWGDDHILVVVNFSPTNFTNHSYGVRAGLDGQWTQVLCSQDARFGGWDGAGNAFYEPTVQADGKLYLNVPKFSVIAMRRK
ncbi:alpha-amylase family glycosyl hydrolase [Rhodopirellula sp. JC639]|uniref:alpha-amylase family glycosyl hydrolase n=1 Tax=Stieleria mannarensis TaxID=2755585 RepID=UPI001603F7A1|nr:alpha-amylase family glycosyl hydrolase [Rhodopirellula sp. JC639]